MTADPRAARLSVDLALVALKRGDLADAAENLSAALKSDPRNPDAYYHLAHIYSLAGDDKTAAGIFRLAIEAAPEDFLNARTFVRLQGRGFDARTTRNYFDALADTTPFIRSYLQPSSWLGSCGGDLTAAQEHAIAERLDQRWTDWTEGRIPIPAEAEAFAANALPTGAAWPRTLLFMPDHVASNPAFIASTFTSHPKASLRTIGIPSEFHAGDDLCFNAAHPDSLHAGRKPKSAALADFDAHITRFRPEVIVMDGLFLPTETTIGVDDLHRLKARHGFKLINLITDAYPPLPNYAAHWAPVTDLTVTFTGDDDDSYRSAVAAGATFAAPCQALAASLISETPEPHKTVDLLYAGSRTRNRDFWCAHAATAGIDMTVVIGDRRKELAQSEPDFYEMLGRAKLALSSGFVTPQLDIVVFRPFEAAASGAVTLHNGRALERCFVPYVHYLPFDNVHELVALTRFLLADEARRQRIREAARQFRHDHYRDELFWRAIFGRLKT